MPNLSFNDVHEALAAALRHFEANVANPGPPAQHLESYDETNYPHGVPLILNIALPTGGAPTRWDYGLPAIFTLNYTAGENQRNLQSLARECHLTILPPQWKPALNTNQINLQMVLGNRMFNFHLSVH